MVYKYCYIVQVLNGSGDEYDYVGESDLDTGTFDDAEDVAASEMFIDPFEVFVFCFCTTQRADIHIIIVLIMDAFWICRRHHVVRLRVQKKVAMALSIPTMSENCTAR